MGGGGGKMGVHGLIKGVEKLENIICAIFLENF
jgi:hypothetical protein